MNQKPLMESPKLSTEGSKKLIRANTIFRSTQSSRKVLGLETSELNSHNHVSHETGIKLSFQNEKDFNILSTILKKPANTRTEVEISTLIQSFEDIKFFSEIKNELPEETIMKLHREIRLEYYTSSSVVFHLGDMARKFYIILRGSVYVLIKTNGIDSDRKMNERTITFSEETSKKNIFNEWHLNLKSIEPLPAKIAYDSRKSLIRTNKIILTKEEDEYFEINYPEFYIAKVINCGEAFGEIALRQITARTATIVCRENTFFGVVTKESYHQILSNKYNKLYNEKIDFLKSFTIFKNWDPANLEQLLQHIVIKEYSINQILFKENDEPENIYFVKTGQVQILKEFNSSKNSKMLSPVSLIGEGQLIGHEEVFAGGRRKFRAKIVSSDALLFSVSREALLSLVKNRKTLKILKNLGEQSKNYHEELVEAKSNITKTHKKAKSVQINSFITHNTNEENQTNLLKNIINKRKSKKVSDILKLCHIDQNLRSIEKRKSVDKETKHELNLLTLPNFKSPQLSQFPFIFKKICNSADHSDLLRNVIENRLRKTKTSKLFSSFIENNNLIK